MGHQLARAAAAAALTIAASCGGGGDEGEPSVLDNALAQVASSEAGGETAADPEADGPAEEPGELPAPDPSLYEGANRVVNLWLGPNGESRAVDVWGRRTFTNGPILLAEEIPYGEASAAFGAPAEYELSVVAAGAGSDGDELVGLINAVDGEDIVSFVVADGPAATADHLWMSDPSGRFDAPAPPAVGRGLVVAVAPGLEASRDALMAAYGSVAFAVGDGSGECRAQRIERDGFAPALLGDGGPVEVEVWPGPATVSLHPTVTPGDCTPTSALDVAVEVGDGEVVLVVVHVLDGAALQAIVLSPD